MDGSASGTAPMRVLTFGHGTASAATMTELLRGADVRQLVDVRTAPGSRHNPDATRAAMSHWLPEADIGYRWESRLGGWRRAHPDGPDTALRNQAFRGYAEHMRSAEFKAGIDELLAHAAAELNAVMCAESLWWRCHRKMIADFLTLVRGVEVGHLMHDGKVRPHRPSPEARVVRERGVLIYDAGQPPLDAG
ncbi:DUF488 domain-containing protein [Saccharopolyspora sp. WRP15-2]|uniref:DUF488 domain-containing protein n=1 Tax=Saccharopolyspora oryzae TaxID=2997343 RepID=A0ABT4V397_9PSEU|nr:DUF488 domain-containing protein [Saccharopolyspora oryzae]MDA3628450.1 DUF488 domain-containing protein [Saccharopolyspora oryzae]